MNPKILSLNIGHPESMDWDGKSVVSSMRKNPVPGPLVVSKTCIDGDHFNNQHLHGTPDSVLYVLGVSSIIGYMEDLGRNQYEPGSIGENVTLDSFDERAISVGDIFQFGDVLAQATAPRFPCVKINFRLQHPDAQRLLKLWRRSGVYLRVLKPGLIHLESPVIRVESSRARFPISEFYEIGVAKEIPSAEQIERAIATGAVPQRWIEKWTGHECASSGLGI